MKTGWTGQKASTGEEEGALAAAGTGIDEISMAGRARAAENDRRGSTIQSDGRVGSVVDGSRKELR